MEKVLVTGAGGFIGSHLVKYLKDKGHWVRGADIKYPEFEETVADSFFPVDLRSAYNCRAALDGIDWVLGLSADMGGIGYIETHKAEIVYNNTLMNLNMVEAAKQMGIHRYLFSSSACIYRIDKQQDINCTPLKEEDAYPAQSEDGYGWEKLYTERLCRHYREDYGLDTRIVRFHNVYGPFGTYDGGREKSPAALCRKVALANNGDSIEIWGDGKQTRSYCYIDDCVEGIYRLMLSNFHDPLNLGTDQMVSINELADTIIEISGKKLYKHHISGKPLGVRGRNSDNTKLKQVLKWEPQTTLCDGLEKTYKWIYDQVHKGK